MAIYRRKNATVEARQHEGAKIVVNSALKGNQSALAGDYLVTDPAATQPRGSVYVVAKADFERDNELAATEQERSPARGLYPDYLSHKEVSAVKITSIETQKVGAKTGYMVLHFDGFDDVLFSDKDRKGKPTPEAGWYFIVYNDGYTSFSPADAFEEGYIAK